MLQPRTKCATNWLFLFIAFSFKGFLFLSFLCLGLSSNMLVMIQQVCDCVLVLFVQKLWTFWHLSCLTLMFVSMFDLLSTDKAQNLCNIWKDFQHFWLEIFFLFTFWTKSILGTISWQFVVEFWIWSYLLIERGKAISESRCCRKTSLLTPLENMHLAIFLLICQFDLSCWVYISKSPKEMI